MMHLATSGVLLLAATHQLLVSPALAMDNGLARTPP